MLISRYLQLDVFPARPGGGNPLGVVLDASCWRPDDMQAFATWTNLVETTFLLPPRYPAADYRVRIFTPTREIAFAGHPSIGSAHAVLSAGIAQPRGDALVQDCDAGLLPIRILGEGEQRSLLVRAPPARALAEGMDPLLRPVLEHLPTGALPPALLDGGRRWWVVEVESEEALRGWQPAQAAIVELARSTGSLGLCIFARAEMEGEHDLAVRAFPLAAGIAEDPASGAANALIGWWISQREPDGPLAGGYRVSQGREIGRDAAMDVLIEDGGRTILVGGRTQTILEGRVQWPPIRRA